MMKEKLTFLGIETSCDETAASIVREKTDGTGEILSNIISIQVEVHKEFGGVVPEIAARAHVEKIEFIIKKAIKESGLSLNKIDGISATAGPGLIVCLTVGLNIGKAIAGSLRKPFVAVNHLEGHALSPKINNKIKYPYLLLQTIQTCTSSNNTRDIYIWVCGLMCWVSGLIGVRGFPARDI